MMSDDDRPKKPAAHEIGQDLSALSIEDIEARIVLLTAEIKRLEEAKAKKLASRQAADSVFRF